MSHPEICIAQMGARRHYAIPAILNRKGWLERFYTDLHAQSWPVDLLASLPYVRRVAGVRRARSRQIGDVPHDLVYDFPWFGIKRMLAAQRPRTTAQTYAAYAAANRQFGKLVCKAGFAGANAVYVFNGAGVEIIEAARKRGLKTIVEQTAADQSFDERLLAEERLHWPQWENDTVGEADWRALADRETEERSLADLVICGSDYVRESIATVSEDTGRCRVVPYGFREVQLSRKRRSSESALNVLFAGSLCLRKGIQYFTETARSLRSEPVRMRAVGPRAISDRAFGEVRAAVHYAGLVPRSEMRRQYDWADVLVLPTLSEGSANVCYEALAAGVPVITTPHAGSVVRDGMDGFIIPIRSSEQLGERIRQLLLDPSLWEQMSQNALARAQSFTWDRYIERLSAAVGTLFETRSVNGFGDSCGETERKELAHLGEGRASPTRRHPRSPS